VSGFRIERSASTAGPWEAAATTLGSVTSYVDAGRQSERVVCYHVIALYAEGESSPSNTDCTTPPAGPTNLVAAPALDAVTLTWKDNSGVEDQYEVQRSVDGVTFTTLMSLPANSATYRDAGVLAINTYWYRVRARKDGGQSDNSNTVSATVTSPDIPNAPSATEVIPVNSSSVRVLWTDNSTNESGFRIERASVTTGPWTEAATTAANVTSIYENATREQQVCFRVVALNAAGASTPTPADCTTPPWFPTGLVARADGQGIALTWFDNSATEDGYKVSRRVDGGAWVDIATLPANGISYRDVGVMMDVTYTYRVQALKDGGFSDYSNESTAAIPTATAPPTAPFGASASYYADNEYGWLYFAITWGVISNNEDGFRVEYSEDGVSGWQVYTYVGASAISFYDRYSLWDVGSSSLAGCFRVIAFNGAGESPASNVTCTEWNNRPTNVTATAMDQQSIDLSWTDNGRFEIGYVLFRSTTVDGIYEVVVETPPNATTYHDTGLASGQEYWYFVASDFGGYSSNDPFNYSEFVSATTPSATAPSRLSVRSSPAVVNRLSTPIRIRGRPTLQEIRSRYGAAQRSTAIRGGVTPIPFKARMRQKPRIR
jgi:titin